eukprot:3476949-Alexandrium_andersonii.AAC.1
MLEATITAGTVPPRSPLAQKFARSLKGKDLAAYRKLDSDAKRNEFRMAWAEKDTTARTLKQHAPLL